MMTFDDFDAWADAVRGADLRLVCDGVETRRWQLTVRQVESVVLQVGREGGGNLCYGGNTHTGTILWMPLGEPQRQSANGEACGEGSLLVIPPGGDFCIRVRQRAHAWCSIALPEGVAVVPRERGSHVAHVDPRRVGRLRGLVSRMAVDDSLSGRATAARGDAARRLIDAATACLCPAGEQAPAVGRPKFERREVVRRVLETLDAGPVGHRSIAGLAAAAGVHSRTLSRVFHDTFGVAPRHYVRLRTLHAVRRALREADPAADTVARILTRHGIWELGRFAGSYRRQFDESPSDTLRAR
jgi:AraC-like DNA-binding protein